MESGSEGKNRAHLLATENVRLKDATRPCLAFLAAQLVPEATSSLERSLTASICLEQACAAPPHSILLCLKITVAQVPLGTLSLLLSPPVPSFVHISVSLALFNYPAGLCFPVQKQSLQHLSFLQSLSPMGICNPSDYTMFGCVSQQWMVQANQQGWGRPKAPPDSDTTILPSLYPVCDGKDSLCW